MTCEHGPGCRDTRCLVLALCAAQCDRQYPHESCPRGFSAEAMSVQEWGFVHGYGSWPVLKEDSGDSYAMEIAERIRDRLVSWIRWPGTPRIHGFLDTGELVQGVGPPEHPLDSVASRADRISLTTTDAGVLVLCDAIERLGAWPDIHAWRPDKSSRVTLFEALRAQGVQDPEAHLCKIEDLSARNVTNIKCGLTMTMPRKCPACNHERDRHTGTACLDCDCPMYAIGTQT